MSFRDHDNCRRCGTPDGPSHTTAECERVRAQRAYDALLTALRADDVLDEYDPRAIARMRTLDALREALAEVDARAQKEDRR